MLSKKSKLFYVVMCFAIFFILSPFLITVIASVAGSNMFHFPPEQFTLMNYKNLFQDEQLWQSVWLSFCIGVTATLLAVTIGITAAMGIVKGQLPMKNVIESFFMGPLIVPLVTVGISFLVFFSTFQAEGTIWSIILAHSVIISPYVTRIACANLRQSNEMLEEAAMMLGAGFWYMFRTVLIPSMLPSVISGAVLSFLVSMDEYTVTVFLAQVNTVTLPIRIYQYTTIDINPTITAFSAMIILLSFIGLIVLEKVFKIHKYMDF
ncbi:ABC transporter permease [Sporolactobacillus sp. THM7-7]|nr:ABC transporter permease [Sporolactobacillus sp. THM7-7]